MRLILSHEVTNVPAHLKTGQVKELKRICNMDKHCEYVDHDTNFTLSDESSNDALYLYDGVHLYNKGSMKLVNNLDLSDN